MSECSCYDCMKIKVTPDSNWMMVARYLISCPGCGQKNCPKATNHDNACTGSNEPGQKGSRYA